MRAIVSLIVTVVVLAALAMGVRIALDAQMRQPSGSSTPVVIDVTPGTSVRTILQRLGSQGVVRNARAIEWDLRLHGQRPRMQAGTYEIAPHASARDIVEQIAEGRVLLESVTIVEGWTFAQMRRALDEHVYVQHELRALSPAALMQALGHAGQDPEGRFFPDTYRFPANSSDRRILEQAYARMHSELDSAWAARAAQLPLKNEDEALIMASIIEKETARGDERSKVAAVFENRLKRGMRLQTDPSVIYGLGSAYDGTIHTRDLETDTPYNTYTRSGLPPTPIALPGAASLQATLHPADTDVLYFVATGDGDGSHHFSSTLEEHDEAVRAYLRKIGVQPSGADSHSP